MSTLAAIQIGANLASLVIYGFLAKWFIAPWLKTLGRADALIALAIVHLFRYVALITFSAQHDGYPISNVAAGEAIVGDVAGAVLALAAIWALRRRWRLGIALSWLLVIETVVDIVVGVRRKSLEPLWGQASGVTWVMLNFYVTLIIVSVPLLVWQLYSRRGERLAHEQSNGDSEPEQRSEIGTSFTA
jgi:hypothetical protein